MTFKISVENETANKQTEKDVLESIAIVGFSFRFPQEATSTEAFWRMLIEKRNAMTEWPKERLHLDSFYHPENGRKETFPVRGAHFLAESPEVFDAPFFSVTAKEACSMDPQQRGLLETAYTALENAGISMEAASGSKTSVFTGCFHDDYKTLTAKDPENLPTYAATGLSQAMLANRISWFFNLTGPSVNLDSACSSSMIALDMAVQGLRLGDSSMALVAGTNSILGPDSFLSLSNMNFLSPDSLSYSFDARGNGYSKGEGHCVIVLKRVSDAIRDGNTIRAVIRSTSSNQHGHTPGITQPSSSAQGSLIRETYRKAGLSLSSTKYVEAHGTGTAVGDPLEMSAIHSCFGNQDNEHPIYIGAVKSNIGHLGGASGLAALIKTVLVLERGVIPPNANFQKRNPKIDFGSSNIKVAEECTPWPSPGLRRASVNCFGFGGANSHVILEDAYHFLYSRNLRGFHCTLRMPPAAEATLSAKRLLHTPSLSNSIVEQLPVCHAKSPLPRIYALSSANEGGLTRLSTAYRGYVNDVVETCEQDTLDPFLDSLAYTLSKRRSMFAWKSFNLSRDVSELRAFKTMPAARSLPNPRLGFVFTGQGAQFAGMGKDLLEHPIIKASIARSQKILRELACSWSIVEELHRDKATSNVNFPEYSQPLCTILQIALVDFFRHIKLEPSTVAGHSSGEIAAAYCIGALTHLSAVKVALFRGLSASTIRSTGEIQGAMMAVGLSFGVAEKYLPADDSIRVACRNSPESVTLSGEENSMSELQVRLVADSVFARRLQVDVAYHSHHMERIAASYRESICGLEVGEARDCRMVSSVTGSWISTAKLCTPEYWVQNMVSPVQFLEATSTMVIGGVDTVLEMGPHCALKKPIEDTLKILSLSAEVAYYPSLVRGRQELDTIANTVASLFCRGHPTNIDRFNRPTPTGPIPTLAGAPEYPFNHLLKYWRESRLSKEGYRFREHGPLDLLGSPVSDWNPQEARWRRFMKTSQMPWIQGHVINGATIYPAAGMVVMAIEGMRRLAGSKWLPVGYSMEDVAFYRPMTVRQGEDGVETELYLRPLRSPGGNEHVWSEFRIFSYDNEGWVEHCRGNIRIDFSDSANEAHFAHEFLEKTKAHLAEYQSMAERCKRGAGSDSIYQHLGQCGYQYNLDFQALDHISGSDTTEAIASVKVFNWREYAQPHVIHPVTLDAAAQLMLVALTRTGLDAIPTTIPTQVPKLWVSATGLNCFDASTVLACSRAKFGGSRNAESRTVIFDNQLEHVLAVMDTRTTTVATQTKTTSPSQLCYRYVSQPDIDTLSKQHLRAMCAAVRPVRHSPTQYFADLEAAQASLMREALEAVDKREIDVTKTHYRPYLAWMRTRVAETRANPSPCQPKTDAMLEQLYHSVETYNAQGKLYMAIGRSLTDILEGTVDPLQLMFDGDLASKYYEAYNREIQ